MAQPFKNFTEQIKKLKIEKALRIDDEPYAINALKHIGYYALISGYKDLFKDNTTGQYLSTARFEDIVSLYLFDESLRELFLRYLLKIERHLRSLISYYFTELYGESQAYYLDRNNYNYTTSTSRNINRLVTTLSNLANSNTDYSYINFNRQHYQNVPLWVLINAVSFGTLSKMYQYSSHSIRSKVSHEFDYLNERELERILSVITKFRNVCAHGERLYSYITRNDIPDLLLHSKLKIPKTNGQYIYGKHDLFAVVIAFKYMLERKDFLEFKNQLVKMIKQFLNKTSAISEKQLYEKMGFPDNWADITRYHKI